VWSAVAVLMLKVEELEVEWGVMARDEGEVRGKRCFGAVGNVRSE
jgi:hypothetical protein